MLAAYQSNSWPSCWLCYPFAMADILQDFPINASRARVFEMFTTPRGLDGWWTLKSAGEPVEGSEYSLFFGPEARCKCRPALQRRRAGGAEAPPYT